MALVTPNIEAITNGSNGYDIQAIIDNSSATEAFIDWIRFS